jgi:hypothetical protein
MFWIFYYYISLSVVLLIEWFLVMLKVCRTSKSVFAITLLQFTLGFALYLMYTAFWYVLDYYKFQKYFNTWLRMFFGSLKIVLPVQSWLFAMKYLKSYLFVEYNISSQVFKIHMWVTWIVIVLYLTTFVLLRWRVETAR